MTTIKIHDTKWFKENCRVRAVAERCSYLKPKYFTWRHRSTVHWLRGEGAMDPLEGRVLEVERDDGNKAGDMDNARYTAGGFWIPNWVIEWVMEVQE